MAISKYNSYRVGRNGIWNIVCSSKVIDRHSEVATIDGKKYEQCIVVEDKPELKVDDIEVDVNTDEEKPKTTTKITPTMAITTLRDFMSQTYTSYTT